MIKVDFCKINKMPKKPQFKEPSKSGILSRQNIDYATMGSIAQKILKNIEQAYILKGDLNIGFPSSRKFRKHAQELRLYSSHLTLEDARTQTIEFNKKRVLRDRSIPLFLRERAARLLDPQHLPSGFLWFPIKGRDRRTRKISLYHTVDGHRIFADGGVKVKPYGDAEKVAFEGAEIIASVPSMSLNNGEYKFKLVREPLINNEEQFVIGSMFATTHECGDKQFNTIRYKYADDKEDSKLVNICKHEVAARLGVIEYYYRESEGFNYIPLKNSFIPLLSRQFVYGACRALDSLLIFDEDAKDKYRRPRAGELEAIYWLLVNRLGPENALFSSINRDGKIKNYDWSLRN